MNTSNILVLPAIGLTTGIAWSQCENSFTYTLPDASSVLYAADPNLPPQQGTYTPASLEEVTFTPDRRPGYWYTMYGGGDGSPGSGPRGCGSVLGDNPLGQTWHFAQGIWDNVSPNDNQRGMKQRLDNIVASGLRRIVLNRPGGNAYNQLVPQAHFHFLTGAQKAIYEDHLPDWIADHAALYSDFEFGVFIGSWQSGSPATPCLMSASGGSWWDCSDDDDDLGFTYNFRFMDPRSQSSMQETYQNFLPWIDMGCTAIWIDNSNNTSHPSLASYSGRDRTIDLMQSPDYEGIKFTGEAIPRKNGDVDLDYATAMPWMATWTYANTRGFFTGGSNPQQVDPATTELIIVFGRVEANGPTLHDMADAKERGFVVWINHLSRMPLLQRLYDGDNNELYDALIASGSDLADFDADGDIDCDDFDLFVSNWTDSVTNGADDHSVWNGDVNGDDTIDIYDLNDFLGLADWTGC